MIGAISPALHSDIPPKFLTEHFADVGKALGIAALDIIEMNPNTRIPNTSFGSLESIRNWIKFYIKSKNGGGFVATATSKINCHGSAIGDSQAAKKAVKNQFYLQHRMNKQAQSNNAKSMDFKDTKNQNSKP